MSTLGKNVHIGKRADGSTSLLRHNQEPFTKEMAELTVISPTNLAKSYMKRVQADYDFHPEMLLTLDEPLDGQLRKEKSRLRYAGKKSVKGTQIVSYAQTFLGLLVWRAGVNVRMHADPLQVVSSQSTVHLNIDLELPKLNVQKSKDKHHELEQSLADAEEQANRCIGDIGRSSKAKLVKITSVKPIIYQYDPAQRIDPDSKDEQVPSLDLPSLPNNIRPGQHYIVLESLFTLNMPRWGEIHWRAMLELETGAVIYLRAFVQATDGKVFLNDPIRLSGDATLTPCSDAADLDPLCEDVELLGLTPPEEGDPQSLTGEHIYISDTNAPFGIVSPTETIGDDFNYSAITDNFSAVNAYYHLDSLFRMVDDFGLSVPTYFAGTTRPIPVDHRGEDGDMNAHHYGNDAGAATIKFTFGLLNTGCPIGYSTDRAPVIHEFAHACLQNNISDGKFSWCHGFGDALAVVMCDPGSQAPDRFMRSPFMNAGSGLKRHDRDVTPGWAWGGTEDDGNQGSRQILSTTMFRAYRSTGGDDAHGNPAIQLARREFAARYMSYLMIGAVGSMTSAAPPASADDFATALIDFDQTNADFEGHPGGAFHKVIRWSFEKQGLYQPAGAPVPVTTEGAPPAVDVYIDDGRDGEYEWRQNFWNTTDIWSSRTADSTIGHETPLLDETNYFYVRVKNRGTEAANNVVVKAYHCRPGTGLVWPDDWQAMETAELPAGTIASGGEVVVGPFEWVPEVEGHECLLASVSADGVGNVGDPDYYPGDPSNADTVNGPIPHWRLVPFDNNIAQRNVSPEAGDSDSLTGSLNRRAFWINNPYDRTVTVNIEAVLPAILRKKDWGLKFLSPGGEKFQLGPRSERKVIFNIIPGIPFNASELKQVGEDIDIYTMVDGLVIGGMTYRIDPKIKENLPERADGVDESSSCKEPSEKLLHCLGLPIDGVKSAKLRKVNIDILFKDEDC
jgi:hypothetical protein